MQLGFKGEQISVNSGVWVKNLGWHIGFFVGKHHCVLGKGTLCGVDDSTGVHFTTARHIPEKKKKKNK